MNSRELPGHNKGCLVVNLSTGGKDYNAGDCGVDEYPWGRIAVNTISKSDAMMCTFCTNAFVNEKADILGEVEERKW